MIWRCLRHWVQFRGLRDLGLCWKVEPPDVATTLGPRRATTVRLVATQPPSSLIERPRHLVLILETADVLRLRIVVDLDQPQAIGLGPSDPDVARRREAGHLALGDRPSC